MNTLINFVKLDFRTARPGFNITIIGVHVGVMALLFMFFRDMTGVVFLTMLYLDSYVAMPFSIGEHANTDSLYTVLNINRKTVVRGRYMYMATIILGVSLLVLAFIGVGWIAEGLFDIRLNTMFALRVFIILFLLSVFMQALLFPFYYKFTIIKSGGISTIPFMFIMVGGYFLLMARPEIINFVVDIMASPLYSGIAVAIAVVVLAIIVYISYRLSLRFYLKREFT